MGRADPLEQEMKTHSGVLAWKLRGQMSLAVYSPRGRKSRTRLSPALHTPSLRRAARLPFGPGTLTALAVAVCPPDLP